MKQLANLPILLKSRVSVSELVAGMVDISEDAVVEMLDIQAGTFVLKVWTEVATIEDSTLTYDVGDGADPNGWDDGVNGESAGMYWGITGTDDFATAGGKWYEDADTIDITFDNDADTVVIDLFALVVFTKNGT